MLPFLVPSLTPLSSQIVATHAIGGIVSNVLTALFTQRSFDGFLLLMEVGPTNTLSNLDTSWPTVLPR